MFLTVWIVFSFSVVWISRDNAGWLLFLFSVLSRVSKLTMRLAPSPSSARVNCYCKSLGHSLCIFSDIFNSTFKTELHQRWMVVAKNNQLHNILPVIDRSGQTVRYCRFFVIVCGNCWKETGCNEDKAFCRWCEPRRCSGQRSKERLFRSSISVHPWC